MLNLKLMLNGYARVLREIGFSCQCPLSIPHKPMEGDIDV